MAGKVCRKNFAMPSCSFASVINMAAALTSSLAFPIATPQPTRRNMGISFQPPPMPPPGRPYRFEDKAYGTLGSVPRIRSEIPMPSAPSRSRSRAVPSKSSAISRSLSLMPSETHPWHCRLRQAVPRQAILHKKKKDMLLSR